MLLKNKNKGPKEKRRTRLPKPEPADGENSDQPKKRPDLPSKKCKRHAEYQCIPDRALPTPDHRTCIKSYKTVFHISQKGKSFQVTSSILFLPFNRPIRIPDLVLPSAKYQRNSLKYNILQDLPNLVLITLLYKGCTQFYFSL